MQVAIRLRHDVVLCLLESPLVTQTRTRLDLYQAPQTCVKCPHMHAQVVTSAISIPDIALYKPSANCACAHSGGEGAIVTALGQLDLRKPPCFAHSPARLNATI
eukprot:1155283-Pelagomonas_calceolata.AAC.3